MSNLLTEGKWNGAVAALTQGLSGNKKTLVETCLANTRRALLENATIGATNAGNIAALNKVILPVIRRVMPTVIANEIIGVQPMQGPVGQIHTLRAMYADTVPSDGTGVIAGQEALSPFFIGKWVSGNESVTSPAGADTSFLEGRMGNRVSLQVLKETVEAKSRSLSSRWTIESAQDAQAQHGIDLEAEVMSALANEITAEIDQEILARLRTIAGVPTLTYDQSNVSGVATVVSDEHSALGVMMNQVANRIGQRTRRGSGNWAVAPMTALTVLQSGTKSGFSRAIEGTFEGPTNVKYVGTMNSSIKIYSDTYAADDEVLLIGYKGPSEIDAAAFYCPYIPLMSSGVVIDPNTGELVTRFISRYGFVALTNQASSFGNAADYLGSIKLTNLSFY